MKNILYIHGLSSSGRSATVATLGQLMPDVRIIAPDLPVNPTEALTLLNEICQQHQPCIVIGTSMGGMFAQQLRGLSKILVNPA
ncbi:MAG: YqiA/YcfP family alpha/beta fold hydrolase, partial [Bacteroidales bacterium]